MRHILKTWRCYQHPLVGQRRKDKISFPDKDSKNTDTDNQCFILLLHVQSELVEVLRIELKKHRKTLQRLNYICHYDLFSQILCVKKTKSNRKFFCFTAASDTLQEDIRTFRCCRRHKFTIKHCCATLSIFILLTAT